MSIDNNDYMQRIKCISKRAHCCVVVVRVDRQDIEIVYISVVLVQLAAAAMTDDEREGGRRLSVFSLYFVHFTVIVPRRVLTTLRHNV